MKSTTRLLVVVIAFTLLGVSAASAAPIFSDSFTLTINSGSLVGNTYTGSFTWDSSACCNILSFSSNFPSAAGLTVADLSGAFVPFFSNPGLSLFYAPAPVGNTTAFAFFGTSPFFTYGTTLVVDNTFLNDGDGTLVYGTVTSATPEPGSFVMLGSGLLAAAGFLRRKLSA